MQKFNLKTDYLVRFAMSMRYQTTQVLVILNLTTRHNERGKPECRATQLSRYSSRNDMVLLLNA